MKTIRSGLAAAALVAATGCGGGPEALPGGASSERVTLRPAGSIERAPLGYVEYLPPGYGDGASRPLLVFLHGVDENGDGSETALRRVFKLGIPMLIGARALVRLSHWGEAKPSLTLRFVCRPRLWGRLGLPLSSRRMPRDEVDSRR